MLDLAKFEKVKEGKDTTTMRHKDGHEMTILHSKLPKIHREQLKRLKFADGGPAKLQAEPVDEKDPANQNPNQDSGGTTINIAAPTTPVSPASIQGAASITPAAPKAAPAGNPLQQQAQGILGAQQQQVLGAQQQASVDAEKARQMVPNYDEQVRAEKERNDRLQANVAMVQKATGDYNDWMAENGKIDPKHFAQSMPAAQKVTTALGLIIGGFAGGFSGTGRNPAMEWLKDQQEKDIAAQQSTIQNKKNVLGAYQQLFSNNDAAIAATRISDNNRLVQEAAKIASALGTPQAQANFNAFAGQKKIENDQHTKDAAGYLTVEPPPGAAPTQSAPAQGQAKQAPVSGGILSPDAEAKYKKVLYDPTKTAQQKAELQDEYLKGVQVDKSLQQIDELYPQLAGKATLGGYLANKINPTVAGGLGIGAAEALTGGGAGVGAIPVGLAGAAIGSTLGAGLKQGLRAIGGQQETQYETARASLIGYIGSALQGVNVTPTEIGDLADQFAPTKVDSEETAKDKLQKLKDKIKTLTKTGALRAAKMTND